MTPNNTLFFCYFLSLTLRATVAPSPFALSLLIFSPFFSPTCFHFLCLFQPFLSMCPQSAAAFYAENNFRSVQWLRKIKPVWECKAPSKKILLCDPNVVTGNNQCRQHSHIQVYVLFIQPCYLGLAFQRWDRTLWSCIATRQEEFWVWSWVCMNAGFLPKSKYTRTWELLITHGWKYDCGYLFVSIH